MRVIPSSETEGGKNGEPVRQDRVGTTDQPASEVNRCPGAAQVTQCEGGIEPERRGTHGTGATGSTGKMRVFSIRCVTGHPQPTIISSKREPNNSIHRRAERKGSHTAELKSSNDALPFPGSCQDKTVSRTTTQGEMLVRQQKESLEEGLGKNQLEVEGGRVKWNSGCSWGAINKSKRFPRNAG